MLPALARKDELFLTKVYNETRVPEAAKSEYSICAANVLVVVIYGTNWGWLVAGCTLLYTISSHFRVVFIMKYGTRELCL